MLFADNRTISIAEDSEMSKKKKTKIKKLTDEEYGNYLMSLKDEKYSIDARACAFKINIRFNIYKERKNVKE